MAAPEGLLLVLDSPRHALDNERLNPLRRIWCVFELYCALSHGKNLVIKLGTVSPATGTANPTPTTAAAAPAAGGQQQQQQQRREWVDQCGLDREADHALVTLLVKSVDVLSAGATKQEDYDRIVDKLGLRHTGREAGQFGAAVMNHRIEDAIWRYVGR